MFAFSSPWRVALASLTLVAGHALADDALPAQADLATLLQYLQRHHPALLAGQAEVNAVRQRALAANNLPDPMVGIELMDITNTMGDGQLSLLPGQVGQTNYQLTQALPFPGKLAGREAQLNALADQRQAGVEVEALNLRSQLQQGYSEYLLAYQQQHILQESLGWLDALNQTLTRNYGLGLASQSDVIRAQAEITRLQLDLLEQQRLRQRAQANINGLLLRPPHAELPQPQASQPPATLPSLDSLLARAAQHPQLASSRAGLDAAQKARELAYLERYPDFSLRLSNNRPRQGQDSWGLMLELNLPLQQGRRRAEEAEAEAMVTSAYQLLQLSQSQLHAELGSAYASLSANQQKAQLLRDTLLPQAEAAAAAARLGYSHNRQPFAEVLNAELQVLSVRLNLTEAEAAITLALAELERYLGATL